MGEFVVGVGVVVMVVGGWCVVVDQGMLVLFGFVCFQGEILVVGGGE